MRTVPHTALVPGVSGLAATAARVAAGPGDIEWPVALNGPGDIEWP